MRAIIIALGILAASRAAAFDITVVAGAAPGGDGSAAAPYGRLADALACVASVRGGGTCGARAAGSAAEPITIHAVGAFTLSSDKKTLAAHPDYEPGPLVFRFPSVALVGIHNPDAASGNSLPAPQSGTVIQAAARLGGNEAVIVVAPIIDLASGTLSAGNGVTLSHLDLRAQGGYAVAADRVDGLTVDHSTITGAGIGLFINGVRDYQLLNSVVTRNGCGNCVTAGRAGGAGPNARIAGNTMVRNGNGGLLLNPGAGKTVLSLGAYAATLAQAPFGDEVFDTLVAEVDGNDLSDNHDAYGFSFGLRLFLILPGSRPQPGTLTVTVTNNRVHHNDLGFSIDAGFPTRLLGPFSDYTMSLSFSGNDVADNVCAPAVVDFTRNTVEVGRDTSDVWAFVHDSTITIAHGGELDGYAYDNPASDPVDGTATNNHLIVNGSEIPHGSFVPYGPQR